MITKAVIPTEQQMMAREALAAAIAEAAERVLADYTDEQLLGKPQARWVALVKNVVRPELREHYPLLPEQIPAWQFGRLLTEQVRNSVRKFQFAAFERQLTAQYGPIEEGATLDRAAVSGPINGIYVVEVMAPTRDVADDDKPWLADD